MIGNNSLVLNQATMIEAVQFWLNAQMHVPPTVTGVKSSNDAYSGAIFTIAVDTPDAALAAGRSKL